MSTNGFSISIQNLQNIDFFWFEWELRKGDVDLQLPNRHTIVTDLHFQWIIFLFNKTPTSVQTLFRCAAFGSSSHLCCIVTWKTVFNHPLQCAHAAVFKWMEADGCLCGLCFVFLFSLLYGRHGDHRRWSTPLVDNRNTATLLAVNAKQYLYHCWVFTRPFSPLLRRMLDGVHFCEWWYSGVVCVPWIWFSRSAWWTEVVWVWFPIVQVAMTVASGCTLHWPYRWTAPQVVYLH